MENAAFKLTEEFGRGALDLSSEVDRIWQRQQVERKQKSITALPSTRKKFTVAAQAEYGKTYSISVGEEIVKTEFIGRGRREWQHLAFFRRTLKNGKRVVHGIQAYSVVKEVHFEFKEQD